MPPSRQARRQRRLGGAGRTLSVVALVLAVIGRDEPAMAAKATPDVGGSALRTRAGLPLVFEPNRGQTDPAVEFLARGDGFTLFLTAAEAVLVPRLREPHLAPTLLRSRLVGAHTSVDAVGRDQRSGRSHYFIGSDRRKWATNVPHYGGVEYRHVYPGVDLVYHGRHGQLEYDFVVAPGADPTAIVIEFAGADIIDIDRAGDLVLHTQEGAVRHLKPVVYQETSGGRREIAAHYARRGRHRFGFRLADYDRRRPLVIDPVLSYSTFLGGSGWDWAGAESNEGLGGNAIAVDTAGNAYVVGTTSSLDFPTTAGALRGTYGGGASDVFVAKINAAGDALQYATYLGGSGKDTGHAVAVDGTGAAYITGMTASVDFPTLDALQPAGGGFADAYVTKLDPSGALSYSTYLGGGQGDDGRAIAVDGAGSVFLAGATISTDFPVHNALQPSLASFFADAFVTQLSPGGSALVYSTYLGGSAGTEIGWSIAVDGSGQAYVAGETRSTNFPVTSGAFQTAYGGGDDDAFVAKIAPAGAGLVYATYLGGSLLDRGFGVAADAGGAAYVTGYAVSPDFPVANAFQPTQTDIVDAFVTKLDATGASLVYSTYIGGHGSDVGTGIVVDAAGAAHVAGWTGSFDFPVVDPIKPTPAAADAFVTKFAPDGAALIYSVFFGGSFSEVPRGIALDSSGAAYVAGVTTSVDYPTVNAAQPAFGGGTFDAFVARLALGSMPPPPPPPPPPPTTLFPGGGQRTDVNEFLMYASPTTARTDLPAGTTSFPVHVFYGPTIEPGTFLATLDGTPIAGFTPMPGTDETVTVPVERGRNVLVLEVRGARSDGHLATDRDRLTFVVP